LEVAEVVEVVEESRCGSGDCDDRPHRPFPLKTFPCGMFASLNARVKYKPRFASEEDIYVQDNSELHVKPPQEGTSEKPSRSLATCRIQNLTAILNLSLLRRDHKRALRAFSLLLRCERHGVALAMLWELGLEVLIYSATTSKDKAEEFLQRVRLTSSDVGRHPTTEKQVRNPLQ
jgi:hypothetical protein